MKRIISILIFLLGIAAIYSHIEVKSETPRQVVLSFKIGDYNVSETNNHSFIKTQGLGYTDFTGAPMLPEVTYYIAIPENGNVDYNIISTERNIRQLPLPLLPAPKVISKDDISEYIWETDPQLLTVHDKPFVSLGEPQQYRYNYVIPIIFSPVKYYPGRSEIEVAESIDVSISISGNTTTRNPIRDSQDLSSIIINHNTARFWQTANRLQVEYAPFAKSQFWYRFETSRNGMYKLTSQDLTDLPLDDIDPRTIRIFTNGGALLSNSAINPGNPFQEIPLLVAGEENGRFDSNDSIIFYAENRDGFTKNSSLSGIVNHYFNPYSGNAVYWLTFGGSFTDSPQRMPEAVYPQHQVVRTTSPAFFYFGNENVRRTHSGFSWFHSMLSGLSNSSHNYSFNLNNIDTTQPQRITLTVQGDSVISSSVRYGISMSINQNPILNNIQWTGQNYQTFTGTGNFLQQGNNNTVLTVHRTSSSTLFFDYLGVDYYQHLIKGNSDLNFQTDEADYNRTVLYRIKGTGTDLQAYEIKGTRQTAKLPVLPATNDDYDFGIIGQGNARYAVLSNNDYLNVSNFREVIPRDLTAVNNPVDAIIITPDDFYDYAEDLSHLYQTEQGLSPLIVKQQEIFDQFNSGMPDPNALRLFLLHAFNNYPSNEQTSLTSVTLLGSGSIDWRNFSGLASEKNKIILFHLANDTSDDFFVDITGNNLPDIAIGRLPAQNRTQMSVIYKKISDYRVNPTPGLWRNTVLLVADDEVTTYYDNEAVHSIQVQNISRMFSPAVITEKIFGIEYPFDPFGNKPQAREAIINKINQGSLVWYYIGHGNYDLLGHESYFRAIDVQSLTNKDKLPLFIAASCDVAKFDYFAYTSLSERLLTHPDGGSIASLAATGLTTSTPNGALIEEFLTRVINDYELPGKALNLAKSRFPNQQQINNNRRYVYLGDPVLPITTPKRFANIAITNNPDSLFAYQKVSLSGSFNEHTDTQFNSQPHPRSRLTYLPQPERNERTNSIPSRSDNNTEIADVIAYSSEYPLKYSYVSAGREVVIDYTKWGNEFFKGRSSINNDIYEASFIVPGDIATGNRGRILAYYFDPDTNQDYLSYYLRDDLWRLGKIVPLVNIAYEGAVPDSLPPTVQIWLDSENFRDGDTVSPNPLLMAHIEDESGINILGELGHKILLMLSPGSSPIDVTSGFIYDVNSHTTGKLNWQLTELQEGEHFIQLIVFDNFNNPTVAGVRFKVSTSDKIVITDLLPYPNPMSSSGDFTFKLSAAADITLNIYTIRGRRIKTLQQSGKPGFNSIPWDGRDQDGSRLANNTYLYKVRAKESTSGNVSEEIGKVIILR